MNRLKEVALFLAIAVPAGVVGLIITPSGRTGTSRVPYDVGGLLGYCVFLLLRRHMRRSRGHDETLRDSHEADRR